MCGRFVTLRFQWHFASNLLLWFHLNFCGLYGGNCTVAFTYIYVITTHKRSLGQGNIFTGVCLSTGGGDLPDRDPPDRDPLNRDPPWTETPLVRDILDRDTPGQTPSGQRPPGPVPPWTESTRYSKVRAVRILIECILVAITFAICALT